MNNLFDEQPIVLKTLMNMISKGHVPHALIFCGDKSTSKKEVAKYFIKAMYAKYYGTEVLCSPVDYRIDDESHTNVNFIKRDTKTLISMDLVRGLIKDSSESSLEEGPRFFIFEDADSLGTNSSNAILKFVEEPVEGVYIIFLIENMSSLLDTIISRCSVLTFRPLNKEFLKDRLDLKGYEEMITRVLIEYTQNEDEIDNIINDEEMMKVYNLVTDLFMEKIEVNESFIIYLYEHYDILKDEKRIDFFLSLVVIYLKDILTFNIYKDEEKLVFKGEKGRIKKLSTCFVDSELMKFIKEALDIKDDVDNKKSINLHLYLDNLFLKIENKVRN